MERFSVFGGKVKSNDGKSIVKISAAPVWDNSNYGATTIPSKSQCIYTWCIKINSGKNIRFGISSQTKSKNVCCFTLNTGYHYSYSARRGRRVSNGQGSMYGSTFSAGDVIKMRLDLIQHELSFYKNDINQGVAYQNIANGDNITYNLAVSLKKKDCSVTILDFKKYQEINDQKDALQSIDSLKNALKLKQKENEIIIAQNKKLMNQMKKLENEQKENEMKIQEMMQYIKKLKTKRMDLSQYESWNHQEIFIWIMSLEGGRYKIYKDKLQKNLKIQQITGDVLKYMEGSDIIDLGVTAFKDKKALLNSIRELVNKQNNQNANEGQTYL